MKYKFVLIGLLFLFANVQLQAQNLNAKITIKLQNQPMIELVKQIEAQSSYHIYYDEALFNELKLSFEITNASLAEVMKKAFLGSDFQFAVFGRSVFLTKSVQILTAISSLPTTNQSNITAPTINLAADLSTKSNINLTATEDKINLIGETDQSGKSRFKLIGFIKSEENGNPLAGVTILVSKLKVGSTTDTDGAYALDLPAGEHELSISAIDAEPTKRLIKVNGDGRFDISLKGKSLSLEQVTINEKKSTNVTGTQMGVEKLDIKTIQQVPTVFGEVDVLRVVLTLPGVKSVGESNAGFNVRGGSTDQNLILFDDATIYNPTHFFGFFSAFSPDIIKDVKLFKNSIPAKYGGRLSSVLELNVREGDKKEFKGTAGLGLLTSRINLEGPIIKDKTSFILGGRTTYSNWITNLLPKNSGYRDAKVSFYDLNLSIAHQQNDKNSFYATAYTSNDQSNLGTDTTFQYANRNLSVRWKHIFNEKLYSNISAGRDEYLYDNFSEYQEETDYRLKFSINQTRFKTNFNYAPNNKLNIEFGTNTIYYSNKPGALTPYNQQSLVIPDILPAEQGIENAIFAEQSYQLTPAITLNTGLRYSIYTMLGPANQAVYADGLSKSDANINDIVDYGSGKAIKTYHGPEYRLGANFLINESLSIKAGYNTQRQYIHMLSNTTSMSPTDVWKLSDLNIAPQRGQQLSLGIYKNLKENSIETSVEGYYKKIDDFLDYKSGAVLLLNHKIEQDVLPTQGKAYGIEFLVKKPTGKLNGWLSYTYSRTMLKTEDKEGINSINEGNYYPANYDKPHDVTMIGNYQLSKRFSISLNVTYSTGRPITLPVGKYFYNGGQRLLYSERNQYRIPDYFRSDISLNILGNHKVKQLTHNSWTIGVYNLTNRRNTFSTFFVSENRVINGYQLSIFGTAVPFINYNIRFK